MAHDANLRDEKPAQAAGQVQCGLMAPDPSRQPSAEAQRLIEHIVSRYHDTHRREFPEAIALARKVERVHADVAACPHGLADHLALMIDDLESHQQREEQVLFPMLAAGGSPMARFPIARMMREHEDVEAQLVRLRELTASHSAPEGACRSWRALVEACRKIDEDLTEHMIVENEVLFAPFTG